MLSHPRYVSEVLLKLIIFVWLVLSIGTCVACESNGGANTTDINGYVASFLAAQEQAEAGLAYVPQPLFDDDDTITDAERESIEANYAGNLQISRDFIDLITRVNPPPSIENEHDAFVSALDAQVQYRSGFTSQYGEVQTILDLQDLTAGVLDSVDGQETQAAVDAACAQLRDATTSAPTPILCPGDEP